MTSIYKVLGQLAPTANTVESLYATPYGCSTICSTLTVCAQTVVSTYSILIKEANEAITTKSYIVKDATLQAGESLLLTIGITLAQNQMIAVSSSSGSVSFVLFGEEIQPVTSVGVTSPPTPWVRPADWLALPTVADTEQKLVGLYAVYNNDSNFIAINCAGNYTVDWGDGITENVSSGVNAYHNFTYSDVDLSPVVCSRGYKMAIVTITPNGGNLTSIDLNVRHTATSATYSAGWLDIVISGPNLSTLETPWAVSNVTLDFLEQFSLISANSISDFNSLFYSCHNLQSIPLLNTSAGLDFSSMFSNCPLASIPLIDTSLGTSFTGMFNNCLSLQYVPLLNTVSGTDFSYMFFSCRTLQTIPLIDTSSGLNFGSMFASCSSLTSVPVLDTALGTDFTSMFMSCAALSSVPLLDTSSGTSFNQTFRLCSALQTIPLIDTSSGLNFTSMFNGCYGLTSVPELDTALGTNFSSMFSSCRALQTIPLINTESGLNFTSMFSGCTALKSVPLLNTVAGTAFTNMFSTCYSLSVGVLQNTKADISYSGCSLSATELNKIYTNLFSPVTSKTITVTGNWGTASDDPSIATAKGWTVTG